MTTLALAAPQIGVRDPPQAPLPRLLDANRLGDHLDRLYRAAIGMTGSPADAEDLVQDVCVKVLAKPRLVTGDDDLGYLLRVLRNTFISSRRTVARRPATATAPRTSSAARPTAAPTPSVRSRPQLYAPSLPCPTTSATRLWPSTCSVCPIRRRPRRWASPPARS